MKKHETARARQVLSRVMGGDEDSVLAFLFVVRAVPETRGRELEDMDRLGAGRARA
ncbi:hypothetical protein [Spirillospora albida]|uniref:hypothetical protein n=1 Tax=Spirillospora albida TaxID=58123 RepID=UPI00147058AC|nr:hypothetical protein [Spirillospora albida]